jgi:hypothetical protein
MIMADTRTMNVGIMTTTATAGVIIGLMVTGKELMSRRRSSMPHRHQPVLVSICRPSFFNFNILATGSIVCLVFINAVLKWARNKENYCAKGHC